MESKSIIAVMGSFENQLDFVRNLVEGAVVRSIVRDTRDYSPKFISWDVILDEKVGESYTEIRTKPFVAKTIHAKVVQVVAELFARNRYQADCTLEAMDREEFYKILKPKDRLYSLEKVSNQISLEELKEALVQPLKEIEKMEVSFEQRVIEQRKFVKKQLGWQSPAVLKEMVFDIVWCELELEVTARYYAWLDGIGKTLYGYLSSLVDWQSVPVRSTAEKAGVLPELLDSSQPFNLIVESFTITCRPREEEVKGHFRLVPTEEKSFMRDFDFSLNNADKVLLLVDAKKQENKLTSEIAKRLKWQKWNVPVCIMFTEARSVIANYVHRHADDFTAVRQEDYDKQIENAIEKVERAVAEQSCILPDTTKMVWNSLRFFSEQIDPVLKAVKKQTLNQLEHFNPEGFYKEVQELTQDAQPEAEKLVFNEDAIDGIVEALTTNKVIVNQYSNQAGFRCAKSQDVIGYYESLQRGQGYTCDSFSINMKGLIARVLRDAIPAKSEESARAINMIAFKLSYGNPVVRDAIIVVTKIQQAMWTLFLTYSRSLGKCLEVQNLELFSQRRAFFNLYIFLYGICYDIVVKKYGFLLFYSV